MTLDLQQAARDHLWLHFTRMGSYAEAEVPIVVRGEGCHLYDANGKRYLDGLAGLFAVQIGNVFVVPDTKLVMTKSSIDSENASRAAARTPGKMSGNVTFQNVTSSFAPRSIAASSRRRSKPARRAFTVTTT